MSRATRRRDQVDASQSGLMPVFDRRFISQRCALAARADCENQAVAVRSSPLSRPPAAGEPRSALSFQASSSRFGPGFCRSKPRSVVLYRATARTPTVESACRNRVQSFCTARVPAEMMCNRFIACETLLPSTDRELCQKHGSLRSVAHSRRMRYRTDGHIGSVDW